VTAAPSKVDPHIAAIGPTQARKRLNERRDLSLRHGIVFVARHEHADAPHAVALLRARRERPRRRAAECGHEITPSKANLHLPLPCEARARDPYRGRIPRPKRAVLTFRTTAKARPVLALNVRDGSCPEMLSLSISGLLFSKKADARAEVPVCQ